MPGMIDTHRHMWQTAMRGYGADWTLTQYFVWYYLESRPALPPRGRARRQPARRAGGRSTRASPRASTGRTACRPPTTPRPPSTRCARCPAGSCSPTATSSRARGSGRPPPDFQAFARRRIDANDDLLGFQMAFDVTGDPAFPERAAYEVARELGVPVTTHAGVWGATSDDGIRLAHEAGFLDETQRLVHASTLSADSYHRIAATGGSVSVATESEQSAGQGYPPTWALRAHGIPVSLSMDTSVWWSGDLFSAMRATLGADRSREHLEAHAQGQHGDQPRAARRAGRRVGHARRRPGAGPRRRTSAASRSARRPTWCCSRTTTPRCRSRSSTRTATSPSRPSAATCTPCW